MSTYPLAELLRRYDRGQLLQHLEMLYERLAELEERGRELEQPSAPRVR